MFSVNSEVKLSPPDVEHKFELLARYSGGDSERHILKEIRWLEREFLLLACKELLFFSCIIRLPMSRLGNSKTFSQIVECHLTCWFVAGQRL